MSSECCRQRHLFIHITDYTAQLIIDHRTLNFKLVDVEENRKNSFLRKCDVAACSFIFEFSQSRLIYSNCSVCVWLLILNSGVHLETIVSYHKFSPRFCIFHSKFTDPLRRFHMFCFAISFMLHSKFSQISLVDGAVVFCVYVCGLSMRHFIFLLQSQQMSLPFLLLLFLLFFANLTANGLK